MNFHDFAPSKYKRSALCGFVHRIFPTYSSWMYFHTSLTRAKAILENIQYPASFYEPLISATIEKLLVVDELNDPGTDKEEESRTSYPFSIEGKSQMNTYEHYDISKLHVPPY